MVVGRTACHGCGTMDCGKFLIWLRAQAPGMLLFRSWACLQQYAKMQGEAAREARQADRERAARKA